jgi:tRNA threonylcarbamoyladenosine biosynthesis protein TsaE
MTIGRPADWCGQSASVEQTMAVGATIGRHCRAGDLVALIGELGAGKTQLVRGMARGMGLDERAVASPTFVIMQEYRRDEAVVLVHVDAYRIRAIEELESMGWQPESLRPGGELRGGAVVALEWADRLGELLGEDYLQIELAHEQENARSICISGFDGWEARVGELGRELDEVVGKPPASWPPCPVCSKPSNPQTAEYPFCSPQCKMIDLGRWLDGRYVISRPLEQRDLEEGQ